MYTGCNGETCVYLSCLTVGHVYGQKYIYLVLELAKWEFKSEKGNGRPSKKDAWSVEKIAITYAL
jgi:hypothetical protein